MDEKKYEIVILGGGPGGYVCAIRARQLGKKVLLVEQKGLGGVCLTEGCIPTKSLLYATGLVEKLKNSQNLGIEFKELKIEVERLKGWKDEIVRKLITGVRELLKGNGVEIIKGRGRIISPKKVLIEIKGGIIEVFTENIILATGSSPLLIEGLNFDGVNVLTSADALELRYIPKRLLIIGGGYVGIELGLIYQRLGSDVIIIEIMEQILPGIDKDLAQILHKSLKDKGITIWTETKINEIKKTDSGFVFSLLRKSQEFSVDAEKVLVSVGRKANTENLGLETLNISFDEKGFIIVDDTLRTRQDGIFAIGDVRGAPFLAHKASKEGEIAAEVAAGKKSFLKIHCFPSIIFSSPEIGVVGLSENNAKNYEIPYIKGKFPFSASGKQHCENNTTGFVKVLADPESHKILGVSAVGNNIEGIIAEATLAIEAGAKLEEIGGIVHVHPTISESFMESAKNCLKEAIHIFNN